MEASKPILPDAAAVSETVKQWAATQAWFGQVDQGLALFARPAHACPHFAGGTRIDSAACAASEPDRAPSGPPAVWTGRSCIRWPGRCTPPRMFRYLEYFSRLVGKNAGHLMDAEAARRRLHRTGCRLHGQLQGHARPPRLSWLFRENFRTDDAQSQHPAPRLRPCLIGLDQAGEESRELAGVFLGRHQVAPRLFVIGRRGPASRLKKRTQVVLWHWPVIEAVRTPPFRQKFLDGIVCQCFFLIHNYYDFKATTSSHSVQNDNSGYLSSPAGE